MRDGQSPSRTKRAGLHLEAGFGSGFACTPQKPIQKDSLAPPVVVGCFWLRMQSRTGSQCLPTQKTGAKHTIEARTCQIGSAVWWWRGPCAVL